MKLGYDAIRDHLKTPSYPGIGEPQFHGNLHSFIFLQSCRCSI